MTLDALADDSRVFIDANIFIDYFTAASVACRRLLDRCAAGAVHGITSLPGLLEVAHRLMIIKADFCSPTWPRPITDFSPSRASRSRSRVTCARPHEGAALTLILAETGSPDRLTHRRDG